MHDQRLVFGGGLQLVVGRYLPAVGRVFQRPLRSTHVGVADGGSHRVQRHALVKQRLRVEVDAHRGQRTAADVNVADAVNLGKGLRQLGRGEVVQLTLGPGIRGEGEDHDRRVGRVGFAVGRTARHAARQQALRGVNRRLHVAGRAVDIAVKVELKNDARTAERAGGGHLIDPGNPPQRALQRGRHRRGHGLRRRAGQRGADHDHREIHLRQRRHRQQAEAEDAAQRNGERKQNRRHRTINEEGEKLHLRLLLTPREAALHIQRQAVEQQIDNRRGEQR